MIESIVSSAPIRSGFSELLDLANEKLGGTVLYATDDFFAEKENLLKDAPPVFRVNDYTDRGKWMDGWESRRKRVVGHDWCLIRLGVPGEIFGVTIDTSFFTGNFPEYASLEGTEAPAGATVQELENKSQKWTELLPKSPLYGDSKNSFPIQSHSHQGSNRFTHLRLRIFPDGGVARLRVHGRPRPSPDQLKGELDLASAVLGARVITASDVHYGPKDNLILPGRAVHMGGGWETKRRRGPGHDWLILRLAGPGKISRVVVDTNHFKGNYPDRFQLEGLLTDASPTLQACDFRDQPGLKWQPILPETKLQAHTEHEFSKEIVASAQAQIFHYLKLSIYPDGGISRLRVFGTLQGNPFQ